MSASGSLSSLAAALSIVADPGVAYPQEPGFSPAERYPEYRYDALSREPNPVYAMVRRCLAQAGLDRERFGTADWNPLGEYVRPGQRVFVLCNFVYHRRPQESPADFAAKCTHGAVLRALVDYLLIAVGDDGAVTFGNAPLQFASWPSILSETGAASVLEFYRHRGRPVAARDLRLYVAQRSALGAVQLLERRDEHDGVAVDLGRDSLLAPLSMAARPPRFRVSDYDPRRIEAFHLQGRHVYVLHRDVLAADVVVSLPKLKTHEKVGITCALKGCVGAIGHKDCLAHHRYGAPGAGGDEYPSDRWQIKRWVSAFHDLTQQVPVGSGRGRALRIADRLLRSAMRRLTGVAAGAWWGNDTAWRMSLDIARIIRFARPDGQLAASEQRRHLVLIDGIVGGEGEGPLRPHPVPSGCVLFADDPVTADFACARLMGFDPDKIPLLREAAQIKRYPLVDGGAAPDLVSAAYNGQSLSVGRLDSPIRTRFVPPTGWKGHIEGTAGSAAGAAAGQ